MAPMIATPQRNLTPLSENNKHQLTSSSGGVGVGELRTVGSGGENNNRVVVSLSSTSEDPASEAFSSSSLKKKEGSIAGGGASSSGGLVVDKMNQQQGVMMKGKKPPPPVKKGGAAAPPPVRKAATGGGGRGSTSMMNGHHHTPPAVAAQTHIGAAGTLLIHPNNVCKVIKGEIHNVLNVMRADPRYVSPLRFHEELPSDEQHPLLLQLRDLHRTLSEWELEHHDKQPPGKLYLPAFCSAIQGRDISAPVTGAALHAIHKFVLYGFIIEEPMAYTNIANTLLLCTFEESNNMAGGQQGQGTDGGPGAGVRQRGGNNAMITSPTSGGMTGGMNHQDDEQVVLKLLGLSALVVRCASLELEPDVIVGLLDTCLHVSHRAKRASSLLKSAASDALGQIVLEVFSQPNLAKARIAILTKLASLLNPQKNSDAYVVNSLMLVNIALETLTDDLTKPEVAILQNDLCKYLLSWSTTHDLVILSLTMRVIFNLFQTIRNHLKVPLEVFLTSVHLRILEHASSHEEREVALESLLEFCQEPALMRDLYLNYDCDVNCTNLFSSICNTLGNVASPSDFLAKVAVEVAPDVEAPKNGNAPNTSKIVQKAAQAAAEVPLNTLNCLALEGLLTIVESIARRVKSAAKNPELNRRGTFASGDSFDEDTLTETLTEEELQERKKEKASLGKMATAFNSNPNGKEWIKIGKDLGVCDESAESVAKALYKAPGLDKVKLGTYLATGPAEKYPFEHDVRVAFVGQFHFEKGQHSFASSLRVFLHKFRMPGEAQCIDRFMEAFSKEFYRQQGDTSEFKSSDAVFVLAFSTIMLNTDLHNPQNKTRMTCDQFVRNNRSINDGEDLPEDLLRRLYFQIKESELQVQKEIGEFISHSDAQDAEHFRSAWGDMLSKNVAAAAFTTVDDARRTMNQVGLHEKDMFLVIARPALKSISSAFIRSWDDGSILDALKGLELMTHISTYFELDDILNDIVAFLLSQGREFILGCVSLEYAGIRSGAPVAPPGSSDEDDDTMSIVDPDSPLPQVILHSKDVASIDPRRFDISGAAAYRGLLGLNMGLKIVRALFPRIRGAWPQLAEVLATLRDARCLPPGLADLDDFADSEGNVLPLSPFAQNSQKRLDKYYKGTSTVKESEDKKGWRVFSFFGRNQADDEPSESEPVENDAEELSKASSTQATANRKTLIQIAQRVDIEKIMVLGPNIRLPIVKQSIKGLLDSIDKFQPDNPLYEQHAAFALELAVRALFANRDRAAELLPFFLAKFDSVAKKASKSQTVLVPFVLERVVVTILRTHIHFYANEQLRPKIQSGMKLLPAFPKDDFVSYIADRMSCGIAIILRNSFYMMRTADEWHFVSATLSLLADYELGTGLVFDGIASTVEYAVPDLNTEDIEEYEDALKEQPTLSLVASNSLMKVLFAYMRDNFDDDFTLVVPSMVCVEKLYYHMVKLILIKQTHDDPDAELDSVPDKELWYRLAINLYGVCCVPDTVASKKGLESCQKHIMGIFMEEVPDATWIEVLKYMTSNQPSVKKAELARLNSLSLLAQMMIRLFPIMTKREANYQDLTDVTKDVILICDENMHKGSSALYDNTVKVVSNVAKQMISPNFGGDKRYCKWASETFVKALDKNGALKALKKKEKKLKAKKAAEAAKAAAAANNS